jgi:8-oxo-dGTP pyrophosphatase MutT (NUDIX family)
LEAGEGPWEAALREAEEEVGIAPGRVVRLGHLDEAETPTGFRIIPCVGAVPFPVETEIDRREIDEVFPVPIRAFADPTLVEERAVLVDGSERRIRLYHIGSRPVWGLTARIVQNLLVRLGLEPETPVH